MSARLLIVALVSTVLFVASAMPAAAAAPPDHSSGTPVKVVACWQNTLREVPDSGQGGRAVAGLACRVYLFGADMKFPLEGDGTIAVAFWDAQAPQNAKMLHAWNFDPISAKKFLQRDMIGQGYSLFLPWPDYSRDKARLRLRVRYTLRSGARIFSEDIITIKQVPAVAPPAPCEKLVTVTYPLADLLPLPSKGDLLDPQSDDRLDLIIARTRLMVLNQPPLRFRIADPDVAGATLLEPTELSLTGKAVGTTALWLWFADPATGDELVLNYEVHVLCDPEGGRFRPERVVQQLQEELNSAFPDSLITLTELGGSLVVAGHAKDRAEALQLLRIIQANAPATAPFLRNLLVVSGEPQASAAVPTVLPGNNLACQRCRKMGIALSELIPTLVQPRTWSAMGGPGTIEYVPETGALIVHHSADVHKQIARLLAALRELEAVKQTAGFVRPPAIGVP